MKCCLLIILFQVSILPSFAQEKITQIIYKVQPIDKVDNEIVDDMFQKNAELINDFWFELLYSKEFSKFEFKTSEKINKQASLVLDYVNYFNTIYQKAGKSTYYEYMDIYNPNVLMMNPYSTVWTLTKEEKTILGYRCVKANGLMSYRDSEGKFFNKEVTAYVATDLKGGFGPNGVSCDKGTILELKQMFVTYTAEKITKNVSQSNFTFPKNRIVGIDEYMELEAN